jgi:hypothetical protein
MDGNTGHAEQDGWLVVWTMNFMTFHKNWDFHHPN